MYREGISLFMGKKKLRILSVLYFGYLLILFLILWPDDTAGVYLAAGTPPSVFSGFSVALLIGFALLNGHAGAGYPDESYPDDEEWLLYTPVSKTQVITGRIAASILHLLLLFIVSIPFIITSGAVSGVHSGLYIRVLLLVFCTGLSFRAGGILLRFLFFKNRILGIILMYLYFIWSFLLSYNVAPGINPLHIMLRILDEGAAGWGRIAVQGGIGLLFIFFYWMMITMREKRNNG